MVVSWCDSGEVDGLFASDLMALAGARGDRLAQIIRVRGGGLLSRTRNEMVRQFLDGTDQAWLWMIDSDQRVPVGAFDRMVQSAHEVSCPVVSGLTFAAFPSAGPYPVPVPTAYRLVDGLFTPIDDIDPPGLHRVDGVGTGSLMVHRTVLESIRAGVPDGLRDWCWFQDGPTGDGRWLSEDLTFCTRVTGAGFPVHVDTRAVFGHHKDFWQDDQTWRLWRKP